MLRRVKTLEHLFVSFIYLLIQSSSASGQSVIRGRILDAHTQEPLAGANVTIPGGRVEATDARGQFVLRSDVKIEKISVSHTGYTTRTVDVTDATLELTVALTPTPFKFEEVVVTAKRGEFKKDLVPQKIDVISRKDIERLVASDLTDILKKQSGVDVIQYPGLLSGVGIRGFRPQFSGLNQRSLLLVDGRPAGAANLATMDLSNVERVEVLKGPASALYGSQAMGGVINVITRKSRGTPKTSLSAAYGSYETFQGNLAAGGNISDRVDFDMGINFLDRNKDYKIGKGNLFRGWVGSAQAKEVYADGTTRMATDQGDGQVRPNTKYGKYLGNLRLGFRLDNAWRTNVKVERFVARNVEVPGDIFYGTAQRWRKNVEKTSGDLRLAGRLHQHTVSLSGYAAQERNIAFDLQAVPFVSSDGKNFWYGLQVQDAYRVKSHTFTGGLDYNSSNTAIRNWQNATTERAPSSPNYGITSKALFLEGNLSFLDERVTTTAGGRLDYITFDVKRTPLLTTYQPGRKSYPVFNPSVGIQYRAKDSGVKVHGTAGRAFVTPDAFNVAGYSEVVRAPRQVVIREGNPAIRPEHSVTWDLGGGLARPERGLDADGTFFRTTVRDRITQRTTNPVGQFTAIGDTIVSRMTYANADRSQIRGLEWQVSYDLGALRKFTYVLRLFANATHILKAQEVLNNPTTGVRTVKDVYNVAVLTLNYGVEYDNLKSFSTRLSGRYVGRRKDTDFTDPKSPEVHYPAFMVLDLVASVKFAERYGFTLSVDNLTDENYYEKRGYNLNGRAFTARYAVNF